MEFIVYNDEKKQHTKAIYIYLSSKIDIIIYIYATLPLLKEFCKLIACDNDTTFHFINKKDDVRLQYIHGLSKTGTI